MWATPASCTCTVHSGKSAQLQQEDPRDSTPVRRLDQRHNKAPECNRSRWKQCWTERSSRKFCEKYRGRAHRSPSRGRFSPRSPNSSKCRSQHKVDAVPEQLYVQVGSACWKCGARKFKAGHPERKTNHPHKAAYQHGAKGAHGALLIAQYEASLIARPNEAPDYPREPDVYQLRQRFYWRPSRPCHRLSGERRWPRGRPLEEPIQFPKFWSEPHRDEAQWYVGAARRLYPEFRQLTVFKGLLDAPPKARMRHWRYKQ